MSGGKTWGGLILRPIGFARTPFADKVSAPRQPRVASGIRGTLEISPDLVDGLSDLEGFERIWVIFGFHLSEGHTRLKVLPPRSSGKRGVFSTRSPHRPNPIGLSVLRLERIEGSVLHVLDVDLLDDTPIYDIKPYLAYTDAFPGARAGWLDELPSERPGPGPSDEATPADPRPSWEVSFTEEAEEACTFIEKLTGFSLRARAVEVLALGPQPHAYRRIRREGDGLVLAAKEWRARFSVRGRAILVETIRSGYRPSQIFSGDSRLDVHRRFVERFRS